MTQDTAIEAWVDRFRDDRDNQYVSEQHVQRAAAIIRLIGTSALDRGFAVPPPDDGDLLRMHREDATWAHIGVARTGRSGPNGRRPSGAPGNGMHAIG